MVGQLAIETSPYIPAEGARVVAAPDGALAAIVEPQRIVVVELTSAAPVSELGLDSAPEDTDVAWVGPPSRLLVLVRGPSHSTVHLVDPAPAGPQWVAQIRIEASMQIRTTVGPYALAVGARNAAVLTAGDAGITPYQFPARGMPGAAGAA
ncbi:MAG TPA: hypothetical protein VN253_04875, partial [Kofleriaceae bacterium]|nr:hypothetical protein [Kofleriaceae bacterium]